MHTNNHPAADRVGGTPVPPPVWPERPLTVVSPCRARDLPVLEIVARRLPQTVPLKEYVVVAPDADAARMQRRLGRLARVIPENDFVPGVTVAALRPLPIQGFPVAAGWYFQQLVKLQFAFVEPEDDYFLIWDADTVPLRPLRFFDAEGRMLLTRATEHHAPYFETYRRLLGEEPNREFSFIAQHIVVQKSVCREMLEKMAARLPGNESWAWKLMRALPPSGHNLFSEYETYGHYLKNHYPERFRVVERPWWRPATHKSGCAVPTERQLRALAERYDFAAFERASVWWRRWARRAREWVVQMANTRRPKAS
ncbi:MAG: DUF6492 family protein [Limisphaerales bacterium]